MTDITGFKTLLPKVQATFRNGIADLGGHTSPVFSLSDIFPGEKSQYSTGSSHFVTEVEMVGLRIVKIDGFLDQTQAKRPGVKVVVPLCIAGNGRNMV